ncbi:hypothetical protein [Winogradskyella tangerina]|uniref:hypothetical protein n=1 Tax=Winogradskyella tangerina TaxID=2023240 RepID=UPI0013009699|nr:hypothetical protein [Winogradskyella tangerina]
MKKTLLPVIIIIASVVLIIVNLATAEEYNRAFYMRILSSVLLIIAMIFTMWALKKNSK